MIICNVFGVCSCACKKIVVVHIQIALFTLPSVDWLHGLKDWLQPCRDCLHLRVDWPTMAKIGLSPSDLAQRFLIDSFIC